ncbi:MULTISPECIES: hypothetical protein [Actinomadura]|uniref:hypothetical protein n=1 Tax=Actinomadura TaxID=1988 RepID=UPI0003F4E872|nr:MULTISPECIES: hypothetical protein [Actinomadura]RSN69154.1 hypothetical protein DMH08_09110 [Actinomadura sp. WAC 06369]
MAEVKVARDRIDIEFGRWERTWTGRGRVTVPLAAVDGAACVDRPLRVPRGTRRGCHVSGVAKIGVWGLVRGPRRLVAVRRGRPGLHLTLNRELAGDDFDEIVVSHRDAAGLTRRIHRAAADRRGRT